jgi:recombination protein RecA
MSVTPMKRENEMHKNANEKNKALDAALQQIERAFGKGSVMKLNGEHNPMEI